MPICVIKQHNGSSPFDNQYKNVEFIDFDLHLIFRINPSTISNSGLRFRVWESYGNSHYKNHAMLCSFG